MFSIENIKLLLPSQLQGNFTFYPILILSVSLLISLAIGLHRGICVYISGRKDNLPEFDDNPFVTGLCVLQLACLLSVILSVFYYHFPQFKPGGISWEIGMGFGIATSVFILMTGITVIKKVNQLLLLIGVMPPFVYGFLKGRNFRPMEMVVQTVQKHSRVPEPGAKSLNPERHGDYIDYVVDKCRRVVSVGSGKVTIVTRGGKLVQIPTSTPILRKPGLLERLRYYKKFPPKQMTYKVMHTLDQNA